MDCRIAALVSLALLLALALLAPARADTLEVIYPRPESAQDVRESYPLAVLRLALQHSGQAYALRPSAARMQQSRSLLELERGEALDVSWTVTSIEREARLRPVRFPIDRGLIGWRLLLIGRGRAGEFAALRDAAGLSAPLGGQGHDWPDLAILRSNGLRIAASPTYEGLFQMLARGHIDYFPRAISEVWGELDRRAELPIALEPALLLHYPSALYFFVHPRDQALADTLLRGLRAAQADGSLGLLFDAEYGEWIRRARLPERRLIELDNPQLPAETPVQDSELWFRPDDPP